MQENDKEPERIVLAAWWGLKAFMNIQDIICNTHSVVEDEVYLLKFFHRSSNYILGDLLL